MFGTMLNPVNQAIAQEKKRQSDLLSFGRVQLPVSARVEANDVGTSDVKMPMYDFLLYEKTMMWRCYRNMFLAGAGGAILAVLGTIYYLKKKGKLW